MRYVHNYFLFFIHFLCAYSVQANESNNLAFIENVGQVTDQYGNARSDVKFKLSADGVNMFIGQGSILYQWNKTTQENAATDRMLLPGEDANINFTTEYCRLEMELVGANKNAFPIAGGEQTYYENHFLPGRNEAVTAHTFTTITYRDIYPNIDWIIYTKAGEIVKYDFVVHSGGKVGDIRIRYKGAENIRINGGSLTVSTMLGSITEPAPYTYDAVTKKVLPSKYVLNERTITFDVAPHDGTIVIDPILEWATYYGGSDYEFSQGSATDQVGNVYMGGWCRSSNNIATTGAYIGTLPSQVHSTYFNGFLVKFNINGQRQWGTYIPANVSDLACDNNGNVYITGGIDSIPGFATTGAHQTSYSGKSSSTAIYNHGDAYLAKFNSNGQRQWATYYGGSDNDHGASVACDASGNVYVGGATHSPNNIASTGAFKTVFPTSNLAGLNYSWGRAGFLAKFNSTGTRQWGTYFAGHVADIELDGSNNLYITGISWHDTGVATTGAFKTTHSYSNGGNYYDGYLAKFNSSGQRLWGTYYGDANYDIPYAVELDNSGNVYISGQTNSSSGIASTGSHQSSFAGTYDGFIAKFNASGSRIWATYIGGSQAEYAIGLAITPQNRIFTTGPTLSTTGIATSGALKTSLGGNYDDFIMEFDTSGALLYGTYYGGTGYEYAWGANGGAYFVQGGDPISYSLTGRLYFASSTSSSSGISTTGAHQVNHGGGTNNYDAYLAAFIVDTLVYIIPPFNDTSLCPGDTFSVIYATTYPFKAGNMFTVQLSDGSGSFASPDTVGSLAAITGDTITCVVPIDASLGTNYRVRILATNPARVSAPNAQLIKINTPPVLTATNNTPICKGDTIELNVTASYTTGVSFSWTGPGSYSGSGQTPIRLNAAHADTGDYVVTANNSGCTSKDTTHVSLYPDPATPTASSNSPVCPGATISLSATSATSGVTYSWTGPGSFSSNAQNPSISNANSGHAGTYSVTVISAQGCTSVAGTTNVQVYITTATPTAGSNSPLCSGQDLQLTASTVTGATYSWQGPIAFSSNTQNPAISYVSKNMAGKYYVTATVNGCTSPADTIDVVVNDGPQIGIYPSPDDSICPGGNLTFIAVTSNTGSSPVQYQWLKNGQPFSGANSVTWNTGNITGGDIIQCVLNSQGNCSSVISDTSSGITLKNKPIFQPAVSISASPGTEIGPWVLVTFNANYTGGGKLPQFQWQRNGSPVVGATGPVWGTTDLSDGDSISVRLMSSDMCAQPKDAFSNKLRIKINLSVNTTATAVWQLYPNPNKGKFILEGNSSGNVELIFCNAVGQVIDKQVVEQSKGSVNHILDYSGRVGTGVYFLHVLADEQRQTFKVTIE
jgi:hypothetical protein